MATRSDYSDRDRRLDDDDESHATTGGAAAAGAVTGGAVGMAAGPVGAAVGAVGGAVVGALSERAMHGDEGHEHIDGDEDHYLDDHEHTGIDDGHDHTYHYNEYAGGTRRHEDDVIQLREEELVARKQRVQTGEVEVGKRVVSEERTIDVPVTREEVFIERHAVDRRPADDADFGSGREEIRVPVMEEEVDVEKRAYVTEEISVGKRVVQDTERVSGTVRKERAVIDHEGDVDVEHRGAGLPHDEARH